MKNKYNLAEPKIFGDFLKKLREAYLVNNEKLSSVKLSSILGVSPATITKWETGNTYPTIDKIAVLSQFYGLSIDDLLSARNDKNVEKVNDLSTYMNSKYKAGLLSYDETKKKKIINDFVSYLKLLKNKIDSSSNWEDIKYYFNLLGLEFTFNSIAIIYKIDPDFKVYEKNIYNNKDIAYYLPINEYYYRDLKSIIESGFVYGDLEEFGKSINDIDSFDLFEELPFREEYIIKDLDGNRAVISTGHISRMFVIQDDKEIENSYNRLIKHISEANKYGANVNNSEFVEIGDFPNSIEYLIELLLKNEYKSYLFEILKIGFKNINDYLYSAYVEKINPKDYDLNTLAMFLKNGVEVKNETFRKYFESHKL